MTLNFITFVLVILPFLPRGCCMGARGKSLLCCFAMSILVLSETQGFKGLRGRPRFSSITPHAWSGSTGSGSSSRERLKR